MYVARAILVLIGVAVIGMVGYQIGVTQAIATQLPPGTAPAAYMYGPHMLGWGVGMGLGFLGFLLPLFALFLFFGLLRVASGGGRWDGHGSSRRRERFQALHRELHGEQPASGGPSGAAT